MQAMEGSTKIQTVADKEKNIFQSINELQYDVLKLVGASFLEKVNPETLKKRNLNELKQDEDLSEKAEEFK